LGGKILIVTRIIDKNLIIQYPGSVQFRQLFPDLKEATINGESFYAIPHTVEAARILNNIGVKVQSPIRTQYTWPGRYIPRWYQIDTAEFFTMYLRAYCLSSMRTGKNSKRPVGNRLPPGNRKD